MLDSAKKIIGIITDGDLRRSLDSKFLDKKASDIMTKNPTIADKSMLVGEAINLMNKENYQSIYGRKVPIGIIHILIY